MSRHRGDAVEVEDVVAGAAGGQVGVLDRAGPDLPGAMVELGGVQVRVLVSDRGPSALDGFVQ